MYPNKRIKILDRKTAYIAVVTEMRMRNIEAKEVNVRLPVDNLPEHVFFCFFENPDTGDAYLRRELYDKKRVGFDKILNFQLLKKQNPLLVDTYLENGIYLYRNCELIIDWRRNLKGNTEKGITIAFPYVLNGDIG